MAIQVPSEWVLDPSLHFVTVLNPTQNSFKLDSPWIFPYPVQKAVLYASHRTILLDNTFIVRIVHMKGLGLAGLDLWLYKPPACSFQLMEDNCVFCKADISLHSS